MAAKKASPEHWISIISQRELPALTSTALLLDKFANDDVSSLPRLSNAILHDQVLSSSLLKVANNIQRIGVNKITTVSRATVILGIQTVKNICLTSKVIESLLKHKDLDIEVYTRIKSLMAQSFFAGQLAKMMLPNHSEETQEEVYIAAMLRRIGETAFWCLGKQFQEELDHLINVPKQQYEEACIELIGMSFDELSIGLARRWQLGDLMIKSLDNPEQRTLEMQVIHLADKLVHYIHNPPTAVKYNKTIRQISELMKISDQQLLYRVKQTRETSIKLLESYGAQILIEYVKKLPTAAELAHDNQFVYEEIVNKEAALLKTIQHLTSMTLTTKDASLYLEYALTQLARILNFETCSFYLLTNLKQTLTCRQTVNHFGKVVEEPLTISLSDQKSLLNRILYTQQPALINNEKEHSNARFPYPVNKLFAKSKLVIATVHIKQSSIGLIIGQRKKPTIEQAELDNFQLLIQHLNMCLTLISPNKKAT